MQAVDERKKARTLSREAKEQAKREQVAANQERQYAQAARAVDTLRGSIDQLPSLGPSSSAAAALLLHVDGLRASVVGLMGATA